MARGVAEDAELPALTPLVKPGCGQRRRQRCVDIHVGPTARTGAVHHRQREWPNTRWPRGKLDRLTRTRPTLTKHTTVTVKAADPDDTETRPIFDDTITVIITVIDVDEAPDVHGRRHRKRLRRKHRGDSEHGGGVDLYQPLIRRMAPPVLRYR